MKADIIDMISEVRTERDVAARLNDDVINNVQSVLMILGQMLQIYIYKVSSTQLQDQLFLKTCV